MSDVLRKFGNDLEEALNDYGTWLPDAVRQGDSGAWDVLDSLQCLCDDAKDALELEAGLRK